MCMHENYHKKHKKHMKHRRKTIYVCYEVKVYECRPKRKHHHRCKCEY